MSPSTLHHQSSLPARSSEQRSLVLAALGVCAANTLMVLLSASQTRVLVLAGLGFVGYVALAVLAWMHKAVAFAAHMLIALSFALLSVLAWHSGGINSPVVVCLPALSIAALLLLNFRWASLWIGIALAHNFVQFAAVQAQWISDNVDHTLVPTGAALLIRLDILVILFLALATYEYMYRATRRQLEWGNASMESLQAARLKAQSQVDALILSLDRRVRAPVQKINALHQGLPLAEHSRAGSQQIQTLAQRVAQVVGHVLAIAQLETGRLRLQQAPFALYQALTEALQSLQSQHASPPALVRVDAPATASVWVLGDRLRFTQVLGHVLAQAAKQAKGQALQMQAELDATILQVVVQWTPAQTVVHSPSAPAPRGASPMESMAVDADWEQALCERLVKLAGATWGHSRTVTGQAQSWLRWPAAACAAPLPVDKGAAHPAQRSLSFLLVDEDIAQLMTLHQALRATWPHCHIEQAHTGESALLQLEFSHYDALLMAVHMQPVDGLETVRRIRVHPKRQVREVLVIGLSAQAFGHQRQRYLQAGMHWILFRPMPTARLVQEVAAHLALETLP